MFTAASSGRALASGWRWRTTSPTSSAITTASVSPTPGGVRSNWISGIGLNTAWIRCSNSRTWRSRPSTCSRSTLSALIFLYTPATQVAAVSVLLLDEAGQMSQAAAFSTCIMAVVMVSLLGFQGLLRLAGARNVSLVR